MEHFGRLVYLASPLTHSDPAVRAERTVAVSRACGWLMTNRSDVFFFSPIAAVDVIARECKLPYEWQWWAAIDECMLSRCEEFWVLCIPGFKKSTGVTAEREIAKRLGIPIKFVIPQEDKTYVVNDVEPEDAP
jgi:hypothetical protein